MSGWLLIWVLFAAGLFLLGYGVYILANARLRERRDQRRAGVVFVIIGLLMVLPVLWTLIPHLCRARRVIWREIFHMAPLPVRTAGGAKSQEKFAKVKKN